MEITEGILFYLKNLRATERRQKAYLLLLSWTGKRSLSPQLRSALLSLSLFQCSRRWWRWEDDQGDVYDEVLYRLLLLNVTIKLSVHNHTLLSVCSSCFLRSRRWWFSHSENHETDMKNSNRLTMPWMRYTFQKCCFFAQYILYIVPHLYSFIPGPEKEEWEPHHGRKKEMRWKFSSSIKLYSP